MTTKIYLGSSPWDETVSATTFTRLPDTKLQRGIPEKEKYFTDGGTEFQERIVAEAEDWK